jgi:hypothetical protein
MSLFQIWEPFQEAQRLFQTEYSNFISRLSSPFLLVMLLRFHLQTWNLSIFASNPPFKPLFNPPFCSNHHPNLKPPTSECLSLQTLHSMVPRWKPTRKRTWMVFGTKSRRRPRAPRHAVAELAVQSSWIDHDLVLKPTWWRLVMTGDPKYFGKPWNTVKNEGMKIHESQHVNVNRRGRQVDGHDMPWWISVPTDFKWSPP